MTVRLHGSFVGCKVSQADSEATIAELERAGHEAWAADGADLFIVTTCCVTAEAERKSRQLVRRLAAHGKPVVVGGCAAVVRPEQFRREGAVTVDAAGVGALSAHVLELVGEGGGAGRGASLPPPRPAARTRCTLKVQDGCAHLCTYCAVRLARGEPRSVPRDEVVATARRLLAPGSTELVLTGVNLGSYRDRGATELADLVDALVGLPEVRRLRLSSIEPGLITDRLLAALAHGKVARHLHVPLQSADDAVLAAMGRPYTFADYQATAVRAQRALPGLALTTDVIVGFPTEDEEAFGRTLAAIGAPAGGPGIFGRVHVFAYSPRPGTAAEPLGRLPAPVVRRRMAAALEAADGARRAQAAASVGVAAEVLVEERRDGLWRGYSSTYVRHYLEGEAAAGELVRAVAAAPFRDGVRGTIERPSTGRPLPCPSPAEKHERVKAYE